MNQPGDSRRPSWLDRPYKCLQLAWDPALSLLRVKTLVRPIQCYSLAVMAEMHQVFTDISTSQGYVKHLVMTSDITGVFNFGGTFPSSCCLFVHVTLSLCKCMDTGVSNSYGGWRQPLSGEFIR